MHDEHQVPIWFFIGILLLVYGVIILGAGVYHLVKPAEQTVVLANLHADVWWGALLTAVGLLYTVKYRPSQSAK